MKRLYAFSLLILLTVFPTLSAPNLEGNQREKYNFNSSWLLAIGDRENAQQTRYADQTWKNVTLPAAFNEDEAFQLSISEHTDTIVWYRKHFRLPKTAKGKKIFLEFEGIRFGGEFWVNGKPVGMSENGVMAFGFDITDLVDFGGDNVLAARIDNSWRYHEKSTGSAYQWNDRNFYANFGGIPKNVFLHVTPRLYQTLPLYSNLKTTGTYIYAREMDITRRSAQVFAETEVRNEFQQDREVTLEVAVEDLHGKIIKTFKGRKTLLKAGETRILKANARLQDLHFWSWGYGYLYNVYTTLRVSSPGKEEGTAVDVVKTRTGFRKTRFADGMFWLNDRVLQIKGYAERSTNEWPSVGLSVPAWLSDYSNKMMVESNGNTVRWMHVTPWKQDVESCDRVGLIQLMPAGDSEKDVTGRRWEHRVEVMRDAIIYNRNNPSIVFYEGGNEAISEEHMAELKAVRDQYDPYGGRAIGAREMLDSEVAEFGGEMLYINKSSGKPLFATEYCRDEGLRWYWDDYSYPFHKDGAGSKYYRSVVSGNQTNVDARPYNRNQDSFFKELVTRWWDYFRVRPGTGKRVSSGGLKIQFHDVNSHWRGQENYRRSGVVDAMRVPKDAFYAHQVMWNGWVDIEKHGSYICGHWNYEKAPKTTGESFRKDVMVVSTGEKVELFLNGKSKGFGERSVGFLFTFPQVVWEPGTLEAVSYDAAGNVLSRAGKETTGTPDRITLKVMTAPDGFKADGSDLALVEVEVVDREGRRCPLDNSMITFELTGEGEWRGGIAHGGVEGNYILKKTLPVESGVNRVLIRSTKKAGTLRLVAKASDKNIRSAEITLRSKPIKEKDGLSTYIPAEYLPVNLSRGETPKTPSYTLKRKWVDIVAATAGSNEKMASRSYDNNELSEWSNDGRLSTGWIKYELERDATVKEVEMKLTGWRMRSYPIQIFVDDEKVFEGETDKSLGYVCIPVKPTKGRFVTIKLVGQSEDNDAFGGIVEVAASQAGELDLFKDPNANKQKGQLRIVEAEIYVAD